MLCVHGAVRTVVSELGDVVAVVLNVDCAEVGMLHVEVQRGARIYSAGGRRPTESGYCGSRLMYRRGVVMGLRNTLSRFESEDWEYD